MCMHSRRIYIFLFILIISDSPLSKTHLLGEILRWNIKLILLLFNIVILINYIYHRGIFLNIALNLFFILRNFILILIKFQTKTWRRKSYFSTFELFLSKVSEKPERWRSRLDFCLLLQVNHCSRWFPSMWC